MKFIKEEFARTALGEEVPTRCRCCRAEWAWMGGAPTLCTECYALKHPDPAGLGRLAEEEACDWLPQGAAGTSAAGADTQPGAVMHVFQHVGVTARRLSDTLASLKSAQLSNDLAEAGAALREQLDLLLDNFDIAEAELTAWAQSPLAQGVSAHAVD